jgi:hypothetical protein
MVHRALAETDSLERNRAGVPVTHASGRARASDEPGTVLEADIQSDLRGAYSLNGEFRR